MEVGVVEAGHDNATFEIDRARAQSGQSLDLGRCAHGDDALPGDRDRFSVGLRCVGREYFAVEQHRISRRGRTQARQPRQEKQTRHQGEYHSAAR